MQLHYGKCASAPCALSDDVSIKMNATPDEKNVRATTVEMAGGKRALWLHVPSVGNVSWDAVLVGSASPLMYADQTGLVRGQPGSMSGGRIKIVSDGIGHSLVVRGTASEDFTICGREALGYADAIDPQSLEWRRASFQQLSREDIDHAVSVVATPRQTPADKALAPLLAAKLASSGQHPSAIADMDVNTVWSEDGVGIGRGEFVGFNAPSDVPITRLTITIAPPTPSATGASPKNFFLATSDRVIAVNIPEDAWAHPSRAYDIALPQPIKSSCLTLVLEDAYSGANNRTVSIAELTAYSELDAPNATLETVAADLAASGRRAETAAGVLKRAGDAALPAVVGAWAKLDVYGRELAMDVASAASCGSDATQIFLRGLCDADPHVAQKAESGLQQCKRASGIVAAVQASPQTQCAKMPQYLALLGKQAALVPLAHMLATEQDTQRRANVRHQFANAARDAPAQMLVTLLADAQYPPYVRLEMLRALTPRFAEMQPAAASTLDGVLVPTADMATRFLALEPLAALAKAGDRSAQARVGAMLTRDGDWPVRARAAELARDVPAVQTELVSAIDDPQPRVRVAALESVAALRASPAAVLVEKRLESDPWTFVRVAAAAALGAMPAARDLDKALADALGTDVSPQVRSAILGALASHQARAYADAVRKRLDDAQELPEVRIAAAHALGAMCDPRQLERLTELARAAGDPMASGEDLTLGLAALTALGDIHPVDLATRIAKLRDKSVRDAVRAAAEHALVAPAKCH